MKKCRTIFLLRYRFKREYSTREALKAGLKLTTIDSSYGLATENVVKAFQTSNGLAADGYYGPQLVLSIGKESCKKRIIGVRC